MKKKIKKTHTRKEDKLRLLYIELNDWDSYKTQTLNDFVKQLIDDEDVNVNYNWSVYDQAMFFFITTTFKFIKENHLEEALKHQYKSHKFFKKSYYPKYDLSKINTDDNGEYID